MDREQLLQLILEQLARVVEYDSAAIMLIDNDALEIVAYRGFRAESQTYMPLKVDSVRHIFEVIENQATIIIADTTGDPRWNRLPGSEYIHCWLGAPLVVKDRVIGLLNLDKEQAGFYTERHAQLAAAFATQAAVAIENARLYAEARDRAAELGQLYTAAREIGASLDLKTVFEQLAKHFTQALSATSAYVLGIDLPAETLTVLAEYWSAEASESERKSDLGRNYPLQDHHSFARVTIEPQIVARLASDPTLAESERNQLAEYGIKSFLIAPLIVRGQVIGLVEVWESRQPRLFTPVEMRLAETLSQHAASVMENARLYQALAQDKQRLELLYRLGQDLAARLDPEQVYTAIHRAATQLMSSEAFAIALLDESLQEIELVYAVDRGARTAIGRMPAASGLSGYVIARRQPMRVDDADQLTDIEVAHFGGPERARSLLAVPLQLGNKVIGAMTAQSYRLRAFSADDQQTLSTLGYQAAIAIENARLYAETQSRLLDQTLLYECSQALALAHDAQAAIAAVAERMVLRLGATALCYYSYDAAEDTIRVDYEYWTSQATEHERKSALGQVWPAKSYPNTASALRTRAIRAIRIGDPDLAPDERDMLIEWNGKTVLTVPVVVHDQAFGFFEMWDSQVERDYDETEKRLLMSLAAQTAITIENARLLEETSHRAHDLTLLNDITRAAVETVNLGELLQTLADRLGELFNADGCYITLWDEARQITVPAAAYGPLRPQYPTVKVEPGEQTMTASVLHAGHALVADDVFNSPYISPRIAAMFPTKSMLGLPLMAGGNKLGAALVSFHQPHHFTLDEVSLGEQAAGQIALAIARTQLFEATRRSAAELKLASDILRSLNASPQVVGVFPAIASGLKALTQCERVSLALIAEDRQKVVVAALDQPRTELSQGTRFPLTATSAASDILKGHLHLTPDLAAEAAYP
ncbi:MAG: GAF domain-containing protein, partial [Chloroflexota bacterium]